MVAADAMAPNWVEAAIGFQGRRYVLSLAEQERAPMTPMGNRRKAGHDARCAV